MSTPLPPNQAPAPQEYAGDEINALVLDPGYSSIRAGFAGEDVPKSVIPTFYGLIDGSNERVFGDNAIHRPRADMEIKNPFGEDGLIEDWDTASKLYQYAITSRLTGERQTPASKNGLNDEPKEGTDGDVEMEEANGAKEEAMDDIEKPLEEYPLLMTEPSWNPTKAREKALEVAMEEWGVPAFFIAKTGLLAAYSQGKATALVVDIGAQFTTITATWEGLVLRKSVHKSPLAGNWLNKQISTMFKQHEPTVPMTPYYTVKTKTPVDANAPSNATYNHFEQPPKASFRAFQEDRVLTSFKESIVQTWAGPSKLDSANAAGTGGSNYDYVKTLPPRPFEMPDGWNTVFTSERFKVAEGLFDTKFAYTADGQSAPQSEESLPGLLNKALNACDVDTRPMLLNNIILTGAGSLVDKLPERLQSDMAALYPHPKVRVIAASNSAERKFGAWIGGSVLASLGTFHQMWVSKKEYEEHGAKIVDGRCK
ncbi:Actin/actin-like protein [Polychaeton citri CBS 116435]|uniref:Actin/actin-like protein n=1 Tax=Polychaeton citri CBS 116435 TaxID=1314669 RepID=A0A9P4Q415_9PEZI|nr:Actin/actin-like protein [Polychaeton citri CBS 116435]